MNIILHIPVVLSFVLLAAHFLREGQTMLVVCTLLFPLLLLYGKSWAVRLVQLALLVATIEWLRTLLVLQAMRVEHGMPWARLVIIVGGVALFTACSSLVFYHSSLKIQYGLYHGSGEQGKMR